MKTVNVIRRVIIADKFAQVKAFRLHATSATTNLSHSYGHGQLQHHIGHGD
jgi:hypothetical protein